MSTPEDLTKIRACSFVQNNFVIFLTHLRFLLYSLVIHSTLFRLITMLVILTLKPASTLVEQIKTDRFFGGRSRELGDFRRVLKIA